jgi:hypothetical protein
MTKSETREVTKLETYLELGYADIVARSLSALIRAARTDKSKRDLIALAEAWNMAGNPDFII